MMQIKPLSAVETERHNIEHNNKLSTVPLVSKNTFQMSSKSLKHLNAFQKELEENV